MIKRTEVEVGGGCEAADGGISGGIGRRSRVMSTIIKKEDPK